MRISSELSHSQLEQQLEAQSRPFRDELAELSIQYAEAKPGSLLSGESSSFQEEVLQINRSSLVVPSSMGQVTRVIFANGNFFITLNGKVSEVQSYDVKNLPPNVTAEKLKSFLRNGYLQVSQFDNGDPLIRAHVSGLGGGPKMYPSSKRLIEQPAAAAAAAAPEAEPAVAATSEAKEGASLPEMSLEDVAEAAEYLATHEFEGKEGPSIKSMGESLRSMGQKAGELMAIFKRPVETKINQEPDPAYMFDLRVATDEFEASASKASLIILATASELLGNQIEAAIHCQNELLRLIYEEIANTTKSRIAAAQALHNAHRVGDGYDEEYAKTANFFDSEHLQNVAEALLTTVHRLRMDATNKLSTMISNRHSGCAIL